MGMKGRREDMTNRMLTSEINHKKYRSAAVTAALVLMLIMLLGTCQLLHAETAAAATAPSQVTLKSVKHNGDTLTVKWKYVEYCSGYQIQYSMSPKFKNSQKAVVNGASKVTKTIKGLKSGKTYYVRVRSYYVIPNTLLKATIGEAVTYSSWSKVKKVKI